MGFSELTTSISGNAGQYSKRAGGVDRIIIHHCASTSLSGVLAMMSSGSREVSANYVIGNSGEIVGVVPEESRAWTSSSASWDGRAITFEIVNETGAPDWRISDSAFTAVAKMLADISRRYGIELSRATVITHQELYNIHGASYETACPGPYLQGRMDELIALAKRGAGSTIRKDTRMHAVRQIGLPDSGVIIGGGQPPRARTNSVFVAECAGLGITPIDCPDWQYGTIIREAWADFNTTAEYLAKAVAGKVPSGGTSPIGLSDADAKRIAKAVADEHATRLEQ